MKKTPVRIAAVTTLVVTGLAACGSDDSDKTAAREGDVALVDIAVLEAPSNTSFYAPIIDGLGLDKDNGIDITFTPKSATALRTEVANGSVDVSAGATVLTDVALLNQQGANTQFLFNVFDWWGTVVTPADSSLEDITDLEGQRLVGALSTTNYAMFKMSAGLAGVDLSTLKENSAEPSGLVAAAQSGREDAVQLWEPAYTVLTDGNGAFRGIDLVTPLKESTGVDRIPYIGVAVQDDWLEDNDDLVQPMYDTFRDAVEYIQANPEEAAKMIAADTGINEESLVKLLGTPEHMALNVYPAKDAADELDVFMDAAVEYGVLKSKPAIEDLVYGGEITK